MDNSNNRNDVYKKIGVQSLGKKKKLIVFDNMIADMLSDKKNFTQTKTPPTFLS